MRHYLKFSLYTVVLLMVSCLFYACSEEELIQSDTVTGNNLKLTSGNKDFKVKLRNNYLWFNDSATFEKTLNELQTFSREELDAWEKQLGFTSIRFLFEKAVDEDEAYFEKLEAFTEKELEAKFPNGVSPHSAYVLKNANLFRFHDEGWFEIDIPYQNLFKVLNKEGIVRIGDKIKKYSFNAVKIIHDGDESKIELLSTTDQTNSKNHIQVNKVMWYRKETGSTNAKLIDKSFQVNNCTGEAGRYSVHLSENITHQGLGGGRFLITHSFNALSYRRTVYGYIRRFKTGYLTGRVDYQASYGSGGRTEEAGVPLHTIGAVLYEGEQSAWNANEIYWSKGVALGRDNCTCNYEEGY